MSITTNPRRGGMAKNRTNKTRQRSDLIQDVKKSIPKGVKGDPGSPGAPGGVTSYNGRTGVVTSILGDTVVHASTHANGGSDELNVAGLSGQLADGQTALAHSASHENAGSDEINIGGLSGVAADPQPPIIGAAGNQAVAGNDARLTDARTPLAHKTSHENGGADEMSVAGLSGLLADPQTPDLTAHLAAADPHTQYQKESEKGAVSGYASLDGAGLVPQSQLPAIAITDTFVVASQAAMLALTAQTGDVAVRSDLNKSFILAVNDPTILANWQELLTPTDAVLSVNGETGAVSLVASEIPYSGAPGLAAVNVEAALDELDSEKATPAQIATAVSDHVALADPHTQYQKESEKSAAGGYASLDGGGKVPIGELPAALATDTEVATAVSDHVALADPHVQYQKESEKGAVSGYAGLDASTRVPQAQLGTGSGGAGTKVLYDDQTYKTPTGAAPALVQAEVSIVAAPRARRSGRVQITGLAGLTIGKAVLVQQAVGPYTGKGTRDDEADMDAVSFTGKVTAADKIDLYWGSRYRVRGNYKVNYMVSA